MTKQISLQKRVSHQPSPDGYAWVDLDVPDTLYSDDLGPLMVWLRANKEEYRDTVLRVCENRLTFKFTGQHIEV